MANQKKPAQARKTAPIKPVRRGKTKKKGLFKGRKMRWDNIGFYALIIGAILAVAFFIYIKVQGEISLPENAVGSLLTPVQGAVRNATAWVRDHFSALTSSGDLINRVSELELENMRLQYEISQLQEDERENERLSALVGAFSRYNELDPIYARVIAKDPGQWFEMFTINQGQLSGVARGMAVISAGGLVGRVYEVGLNYAKVVCIINADNAVACLIERTRDNGILRGQLTASASDSHCRMYYIPQVNDIVPGDSVVTSGLDGVYPKGLTVGTVTEVSRQSETSDQYLIVQPSADFGHIEEVLVLQTVIESASNMAPVPSPTTRAVPTTLPPPTPTPLPGETLPPNEAPNSWAYPTTTPDPNATQAPAILGNFIEDVWAASD